jgi:hypothetical protein
MADMISQKLGDIYKTTSISQKPTGPITCWNEGKNTHQWRLNLYLCFIEENESEIYHL